MQPVGSQPSDGSAKSAGKVTVVSRYSAQAREAALRRECHRDGYELVNVSYYYQNGRKKRKSQMRKIRTPTTRTEPE